jgi:hypothetical protein
LNELVTSMPRRLQECLKAAEKPLIVVPWVVYRLYGMTISQLQYAECGYKWASFIWECPRTGFRYHEFLEGGKKGGGVRRSRPFTLFKDVQGSGRALSVRLRSAY